MKLLDSRDGRMKVEAETLEEYLKLEDMEQFKYAKRDEMDNNKTIFHIIVPKREV